MNFITRVAPTVLTLLFLCAPQLAQAKSSVRNHCPKNCYPMLVMRVIDGDTVQGYIHTNDDEAVIYAKLRLDGIDTPESRAPKCPEEHLLALLAKNQLHKQLASIIRSYSINRSCACDARGGKFAKRRVGSLKIRKAGGKKWRDVTKSLKRRCFAIDYNGKGARANWCGCLKNGNCPTDKFPAKCIKRFTRRNK